MLEQINTLSDRYTLTEQFYTQAPTKQSNETCDMLSLYKYQIVHLIDSLIINLESYIQHSHSSIHWMYKFDMI